MPLMVETIRSCLQAGEEDDAIVGFEIFDDLVESVRTYWRR